jgi:nicotinamidase-related amidase
VTTVSLDRDAALLVIDVQKGLDEPVWGRRNNPEAEANIARLLESWRGAGSAVYHVRHYSRNPHSPLREGTPGVEIKDEVRPLPGEPVITKSVNSSFIGTDLEERLRSQGIGTLVITGLTTNHCVETTARMAGNLGFETYLVSDATATFDREGPDGTLHRAEEIQAMTLANLHGEFAEIVTTPEVLERLAGARAGG